MIHQRAFTLVELVVSVAIASVLLLGMGSAMMIASEALPSAEGVNLNAIAAAEVAEQMAVELQYAMAIHDSNSTAIEVAVADRDGDNVPEIIRYQWSGTAGDALTRQYNQGSTIEVLSDVQEFGLSYDLQSTTTGPLEANESAETLLSSHKSYRDWQSQDVTENNWLAQFFSPSLPADTVSWRITRVSFYAAAKNLLTGQCKVQIQSATAGGIPTGTVLEERTLKESTLGSAGWTKVEFDLSEATGLSPDQDVCLVLEWFSGTEACQVLIQGQDVPASSAGFRVSTDQGETWAQSPNQSFLFEVHGTVTTSGTPDVESSYYLDRVTVNLQKGSDSQAHVIAQTRLLNRPEVVQ